jgi:beta-glucanase (GH16 family)
MPKSSCFSALLLLLTASIASAQWTKVWSDEFDKPGLPDSAKWGYEEGYIRNGELQFYTVKRAKNARVEKGHLILEAHREDFQGKRFTSASLRTKGKADWHYGRVEVRAKLPGGVGLWPAVWMLPTEDRFGIWPASGEIDIMEHVGFDKGVVHGTIHNKAYNHIRGTQKGKQVAVADCEDTFHVYAMEWSKEKIDVFVDDKKYFSFENDGRDVSATWPFDHPFYLILNIAIGGSWGGQKGVNEAVFPQRMEIDYVRVFKPSNTLPLTISTRTAGDGDIKSGSAKSSYQLNEIVKLTAAPAAGYEFRGWTGDIVSKKNPLEFNAARDLDLIANFAKPNDLLVNGDFTHGAQGWNRLLLRPGSAAIGKAHNGEYHAHILFGGTNEFDIQLNHEGMHVKKGKSYRLSFDARADANRSIDAAINMVSAPWTTYHKKSFDITAKYQSYSFEFTMKQATDKNARVEFDLGVHDQIDVYLDNIKFQEIAH